MELLPPLTLGWCNGWIFLALLAATEGILFWVFPKDVVERLFDRSGWSQKQIILTVVGKICALMCLLQIIFTPLKIGSMVFVLGACVAGLGLLGLAKALFDFKNTPIEEPVTRGLYRISRHPQIVMASVVLLGACIAIGSWGALLLLAGARLFSHLGIRAEEEVCLKLYGERYHSYMARVPRYFIFF